jgi:hypothetical protein
MRSPKAPVVGVFLAVSLCLALAASASGYDVLEQNGFKGVGVPVGTDPPEVMVHQGEVDGCFDGNYVDIPANAFKDNSGNVRLTIPHTVSTTMSGSSLYNLQPDCPRNPTLPRSQLDPSDAAFTSDDEDLPDKFTDGNWLGPTYAEGNTVYSHFYTEWHALQHDNPSQNCTSGVDVLCIQISAGLATSSNDGLNFTHAPLPANPNDPPPHYVSSLPYRYQSDWGIQGSGPGQIFKRLKPGDQDAYYYSFFGRTGVGLQERGTCLGRTDTLAQPSHWRLWDGDGFDVSFMDPYRSSDNPANHVCQPISQDTLVRTIGGVTYNTYLQKYLMIGINGIFDPALNSETNIAAFRSGAWYSTSDDLFTWSPRKLLTEQDSDDQCRPILYPTVLDPQSSGRNFEQSDQQIELFMRRRNLPGSITQSSDCNASPPPDCDDPGSRCDRDLFRIPLEITKLPTASFTVASGGSPGSSVTVTSPATVNFDGSASSDPEGAIANYKWDLDGNGSFETDTGTTATTSKNYTASNTGVIKVGLQVTDGSGATGVTKKTVVVNSFINFQPPGAVPAGYTADIGNAFPSSTSNSRRYGWITEDSLSGTHQPVNLTTNARKRNVSSDLRLDTLMWMQWPDQRKPNGAWEMEVPNGTYSVSLWAGDPAPVAQQFSDDGINVSAANHRINVEGVNAISSCVQSFSEIQCPGSATVVVTDGRLTIDATGGGFNARIDYVDITPVAPASPTASFTATQPDKARRVLKLDATASTGRIVRYEWDLDGNGIYDRDMEDRPVNWAAFARVGPATIKLRVTDSGGNTATVQQTIPVDSNVNFQPNVRTPWQASHAYGVGEVVVPTTANGHVYRVTTAGTSGAAQPAFNTATGSTTTDGSVVWTESGSDLLTAPPGYAPDSGVSFATQFNQGWVKQSSLASSLHEPLYMRRGVDRAMPGNEVRLNRFMPMQPPSATAGAWEIQAANGTYTVTVSVGDANTTESSAHQLRIEGTNAFAVPFVPTPATKFATATKTVTVSDGRLTVDATGGTNTKINYVEVDAQ